eukprot:5521064-Pyramimonas_sp.AAC.2
MPHDVRQGAHTNVPRTRCVVMVMMTIDWYMWFDFSFHRKAVPGSTLPPPPPPPPPTTTPTPIHPPPPPPRLPSPTSS